MRIKLKKNEILAFFCCVITSIYYTLKGWNYSSYFVEFLLVIGILCGIINLLQFHRLQANRLFLISPIIILTIYRMTLGADTRMLVSLLAMLIGMNVNFEKISVWILKSKIIAFLIAVVFGGYAHRNYLSMNIGTIVFLMLYIYYPKNKVKALSMGIIIFIFGVLISKSGAMLICGGIGLSLYLTLNNKIVKRILRSRVLIFLFPLVLMLNWFLVVLYAAYGYFNSDYYFIKKFVPSMWNASVLPFLDKMNTFLSGRISLAAFSICKFGISAWGGNIDYTVDTGLPYFLVDSGMILLLQDWGLIMTSVAMVLFVFFMWKLIEKKEYRLIISAIVIALWAFNEDTLLSIGSNYLFFAIGTELISVKASFQKKKLQESLRE